MAQKEDQANVELPLEGGSLAIPFPEPGPSGPGREIPQSPEAAEPFRCIDCEALFSVPSNVLSGGAYSSHCPLCDRPVAVQEIVSEDTLTIYELTGCERSFVRDLSVHTQSTRVEPNPLPGSGASFVEGLLSRWEVQCASGQTYDFEYFSALRKWIEDGRIKATDIIIPSDGRKYRADQYPGTADLFGNPFLRTEARFGSSNPVSGSKTIRRRNKWIAHVSAAALASLLLGGLTYTVRTFQYRQGENFLNDVLLSSAVTPAEKPLTALLNAKSAFYEGTPESFVRSANDYTRAIAAQRHDPEAIAGLSEAWVEISNATKNTRLLEAAETLLAHGVRVAPQDRRLAMASARLLWRKGEADKAIETIRGVVVKEPHQPEARMLLAQISASTKDFATATVELDRAIQIDPTNPRYLDEFARLLESQQKYLEAAEFVKRQAALALDAGKFSLRLFELYRKGSDLAAAESILSQSISNGERSELTLYTWTEYLSTQQRPTDVIRAADQYLAAHLDGSNISQVRKFREDALSALSTVSASEDIPVTSNRTRSRRFLGQF